MLHGPLKARDTDYLHLFTHHVAFISTLRRASVLLKVAGDVDSLCEMAGDNG